MTRRWLLIGAVAIVCLANMAALGLGALNRRDARDAPITLTERELPFSNHGPDSTATELRVGWMPRDNSGFACDKIRPLGFMCPEGHVSSDSRIRRQPPRNGYVVLEYDGPAWEQVRKQHEAQMAEFAARNPSAAASTNDSSWNNQSHLVAIDIGPDAAALRRTYPDGSRYLITTARIAARITAFRDPPQISTLAGFITELMPSTINVPLPFSTIVRGAEEAHSLDPHSWTPRYSVTLQYGRFLEPWIVDAKAQ